MRRKLGSSADVRPGSASRPLDASEVARLHEWCRAHGIEPRKGDRRDERDAALRQWAALEVQDYKPRDPRLGLDVLRQLFRAAAPSHAARCAHRHRFDVRRRGTVPALRVVVADPPVHIAGPDVLAPRLPARTLADRFPPLRFFVRDSRSEGRRWAAARAVCEIARAYAVEPSFPLAAIQAARGEIPPARRGTPEGLAELADRIAMHSVAIAFAKVEASVRSDERALVDARAYALIERMIGVSEGVLRRDMQSMRGGSGS